MKFADWISQQKHKYTPTYKLCVLPIKLMMKIYSFRFSSSFCCTLILWDPYHSNISMNVKVFSSQNVSVRIDMNDHIFVSELALVLRFQQGGY